MEASFSEVRFFLGRADPPRMPKLRAGITPKLSRFLKIGLTGIYSLQNAVPEK